MTTETTGQAIDRAEASQKPPVIFIHGLWLKPSSWDRWIEMFEAAGYAALAPGWPAEVGGAAAPETIGDVVAHFTRVAGALSHRPAIVGHSFGGLIAQTLAGHGLSAATVAIDPAPFRGDLARSVPAWPGLQKPAARGNVGLTAKFRCAFGNAMPQAVSEALYGAY